MKTAMLAVPGLLLTLAAVGAAQTQSPAPASPPAPSATAERLERLLQEIQATPPELLPAGRVSEAIELLRQQRREGIRPEKVAECRSSDGRSRAVNDTVIFGGWRYRCVEVFDEDFAFHGTAWTLVETDAEARPTTTAAAAGTILKR